MDSLRKFLEDWGKFLAVLTTYVIGRTKYPAEVEIALANAGIEARLFSRAISRAINHNIVAWMRPIFMFGFFGFGLVFGLGLAPLVMLAYGKAILIVFVTGMAWLVALAVLLHRSAGVRAINDRKSFYAKNDEVQRRFGPSDRFSVSIFIAFPAAFVFMGLVLMMTALGLRAAYGTSVFICWCIVLVGFLSIVFGFALFSYVLMATKRLVGSVGGWAERIAGMAAEKAFDWGLLGVDKSNASLLIPDSVVKVVVEFIEELEKSGKLFINFMLPLLALAGATLSLGLTFIVLVASVLLGAYIYSFSKSDDKKENEKAKAGINVSRAFLYATSSFFFVVNVVAMDAFGLHATPSTEGGVHTGFWLMRMMSMNPFAMVVVTTVLTWLAYKLYHMKLGESLLHLHKVGALILFGFLGIMTVISIGYWTGENITPTESYFNRFKHPDDEALYCLNGMQDFDEIGTDYGPSCGPYRRGTNQPGYRSSSEQPFEVEPDAVGGPIRYFTCSHFAWFCPQPEAHANQRQSQPSRPSNPRRQRPRTYPSNYNSPQTEVAVNDTNKARRGHPIVASGELSPYEPIIADAHAQHPSIPPHFIRAVMWVESRFHQNVRTSSAGANGLMQFMPRTAAHYGITDVRDPHQVIPAGARYLSDLFARAVGGHEDRLCLAAAGYNSGSGGMQHIMSDRVRLNELLQACRTGDLDRYPRHTKQRYAVTVMNHYYNYLNGIRPDDPSRRQAPSRRPVEEEEPESEQQLIASAELVIHPDVCNDFVDSYRNLMRSMGRCP